jgi:hypothetical protein
MQVTDYKLGAEGAALGAWIDSTDLSNDKLAFPIRGRSAIRQHIRPLQSIPGSVTHPLCTSSDSDIVITLRHQGPRLRNLRENYHCNLGRTAACRDRSPPIGQHQ